MKSLLSFPGRKVSTAAFVATLLLLGCREGISADAKPTASAFRLQTLDGKLLGPKDFPGKVVVVDFWATWCGPCHIQARILEPLYKDYSRRGVQFLAANVGEPVDTVRSFLKTKPLPYTVLVDPEDVAGELGVFALPTLMIVDKKGKIAYFEPGIADADTIRKVLKQAGV